MNSSVLGKDPIHFGAPDRPLFGFFHPAAADGERGVGVVLCNPIGDDLIRTHRPFRHLAERLARAGFAVLRFDYHGTGDSPGDERDPGAVDRWTDDVSAAADELRARAGVDAISFVGLRLGATLATAAAARRDDVESLVLWSPYATGAAFVAETTKVHRMHKLLEPKSFSGGPPATGGEEALGFFLTDETIAALGALDLGALASRPAPRALVIGMATIASDDDRIVAALGALGVACSRRAVAGQKFLMTPPHQAALPEEAIDGIVAWLSAEHAPAARATMARLPRARLPAAIPGEEPVVFGTSHPLFGILVRPSAAPVRRPLPAIIMLNAGCVHRIGPHRAYIGMARRWAALGFPVLRVDLSGIGDSPAAPGCQENLTYPRHALADIDAAMELLSAKLGVERFVVTGLCSGGDLAFQAGFRNRRVAGVVMMNPRTFCVHDLSMVDAYHQARWYEGAVLRKESWMKLLRGEVDVLRVARKVAPKVKAVVTRRVRKLVGGETAAPAAAGEARQLPVPGCLRLMAERGVDTLLLVTRGDPGIDYVDANFGREMQALAPLPGWRRVDLDGTDHTFTALWAKERVADLVTEHLRARHLAVAAA